MLVHAPLLFLESLGTGEVMLIVFVIIVFFGGKKIPEMARVLGKGMREFKAAANNIQDEIQKSVTEIERNVNIEHAFQDEPAKPPVLVEDPQAPVIPQHTPPAPQLLRADQPEEKKEVPPPAH
jgi:TatA/E family protein of Tat protein translocase